ncbi:MAG: PSD1 domain-containing protein, partial [Planctomycetales bacterium]|nr:PSD1 domain-containing protein [Planctomycetales bacterium]
MSLYDTALSADRVRQRFASFATREAVTQRKRASEEKQRFFENTIRPLLVAKCVDCHSGEESSESPLAIVSRESLLTGGDFGPAIIPGRAEDSTLIRAVRWTHKALRMPQDREDRLSNKEIADLIRWINDGAVWPGSDATTNAVVHRKIEAAGRKIETDHWAFQSRTIVEPPQVKDSRWMAGPIDRFVESARQRRNLKAVGPATRGTLIRRLTFDLIGLPPTPTEVEAFVNDARPDDEAIAAVADRLLTSKHYGERWGRHWMDVARYADTQGDVGDYPIPDDWRYRNWIIDSLNEDMPFNDFLRAQIAGDVIAARGLADGTLDEVEARKLVIATGYLALSQRYGNSKAEHLHLTYENAIDTIGRGVLGLTLRCSRCHDHPFDPILQTDYYGLYGILDSTTMPWMGMSIEKSPSGLVPTRPDEQLQKAAADYWTTISRYEYQINNHFRPWLKPTLDEFKKVKKQLEESSDPSVTEKLTAQRDELLSRHSGKFRELMLHGLDWLKKEKTNNARRPPFEMVFAVGEGQPHDSAIHRRGEPQRKGQIVPRRFLQVVDGPAAPKIRSGSGRLELADWLTRDDHPLVPRVVVNRIWQRHFGRGLVVTTDNFGVRGESPSHPELLDWLTQQFVNDGWSLKQLHRRIVLSQTYRLSSDSDAIDDDPDNVYLTRFARRRLEGEAIRDAMLAVSGELDITQGQGHPLPPWDQKRYGLNGPFDSEFETNRRSVYLLTQRLFNHSFLGLFDPPDRNAATARRSSSDVPGQSLFLMNSPYVRRQAEAFADRLLKDHSNNTDRIAWAFHLAYGRSVTPDEQDSFDTYIQRLQRTAQEIGKSDNSYERLLWTSITRAILTSNEF